MNIRATIAYATLAVTILLSAASPTEARFLQTDPVGYKDDIDLYTYVGNDPEDMTDPTGKDYGTCTIDATSGHYSCTVTKDPTDPNHTTITFTVILPHDNPDSDPSSYTETATHTYGGSVFSEGIWDYVAYGGHPSDAMLDQASELGANTSSVSNDPRNADSQRLIAAIAGLTPAVRSKLGNLAPRANETIRDVIKSRGGNASNVRQVGPWADRTLGEAAKAAVQGDEQAETAVKIAKDAARLGQKY